MRTACETTRLKFRCSVNPSRVELGDLCPDDEVSFVPMEDVGVDGTLRLQKTKQIGAVGSGYTFFRDDDIVVAKITPCFENGKGAHCRGLVNGRAFGTTELHVLRPSPCLLPRFLYYLTASHPFRVVGTGLMEGAAGQKRVPEEFISDYPVPAFDLDYQTHVADFLDRQTAAIDEVIHKKERMIELVRERRGGRAMELLTDGTLTGAETRRTGFPWLPRIPSHWQVVSAKHVVRKIVDGVHAKPEYVETGVPFITVKNLTATEGISFEDTKYIAEQDHQEFTKRANPEVGDLLVTKDGTLGVTRVVYTSKPFSIFVSVALLKPDRRFLNSEFMSLFMESDAAEAQFRSRRLGSALQHLHLEELAALKVPVPPLDEQDAIVAYWREYSQESAKTVATIRRQLACLHEYRQALITAATTGHMDIDVFRAREDAVHA